MAWGETTLNFKGRRGGSAENNGAAQVGGTWHLQKGNMQKEAGGIQGWGIERVAPVCWGRGGTGSFVPSPKAPFW